MDAFPSSTLLSFGDTSQSTEGDSQAVDLNSGEVPKEEAEEDSLTPLSRNRLNTDNILSAAESPRTPERQPVPQSPPAVEPANIVPVS